MIKEDAVVIQAHALKAVDELLSAFNHASRCCSREESELVKRGVGLSIGRIQTELLDFVYALFPELDHLKNGADTRQDNLNEQG